ncbi:MAG TPA: winged helix-turn-helix domain-containing protein [Silvibacterium sp.]|nr:winged helix-turn-helix domain-containing protein [Silvibacterium sp.]
MTSPPIGLQQSISFGEDFALDLRPRRLRRRTHVVKLERIPLEILLQLLEHPGEVVTREEIVARVWGEGVFLDSDNSIRGAIRKIRQVLKDDPAQPRYIQTITGHGYRFIAPVLSRPSEEHRANVPMPKEQKELRAEAPLHPRRLREPSVLHTHPWLVLGVITLLALAAVYLISKSRRIDATAPRIRSIAVLPLDDLSPGAREEYFADGMTDELITELARIPGLRVVSRTSVMQNKGMRKPLSQIARELNVEAVVEGSVVRSGDRVRITAQLIDTRSDKHLWAQSFEGPLGDVLSLQDSVAREISLRTSAVLTPAAQTKLTNAKHIDPEAYVAYLKGRYYWNKRTADGLQKGSIYFQQAMEKDPAYAEAYSGFADCKSGLAWHGFLSPDEALPKAYAAALKATEIDPRSAEAHASLALLLSHRWDWPGAEAEFKRALQLNPHYANAHHWYGDYLSIKGRHDEALLQARQALELDPLNLMIGTWVAQRYYLARKYALAIEQSRQTVALDPNFAAAHLLLGDSYVQAGLHKQGLAELQLASTLSGSSPLYLAQVAVAQAVAGNRTEALRIAARLEKLSRERYVSPYGLAQIYAALNDKEQTLRWLQVAYDDHAVWMSYLAVDPVFDRFREDQRFQDLLRGVGLLPGSVAN